MSLTYPILDDIYAIKINELNNFINGIDHKVLDYDREINTKIEHIKKTIVNQNVKIDLIQNLFNQYKASSDSSFNKKDYEYLKSSQSNLINSIKSEYGHIVDSVKLSIRNSNNKMIEEIDKKIQTIQDTKINKDVLTRIDKLEFEINNIQEQLHNEIKPCIHNVNTELANLNFRLNGLETKYVNLVKRLGIMSYSKNNQKHEYEEEDTIGNNVNQDIKNNDSENSSNWVKVTKKHKSKTKYNSSVS